MTTNTSLSEPILDNLVDAAVIAAQLESGNPLEWIAAQLDGSPAGRRSVVVLSRSTPSHPKKAPNWTLEEERFLRSNLGILPEAEIARRLGRSETGVHLHWKRDMKLPAPSKHPDALTGHQVAVALDVDVHAAMKLIDRSILPGRRLPGDRGIRSVNRRTFVRWALNPRNWIYFDPRHVRDPHLRRLLEIRLAQWDDEWWTPGQVARYHGVDIRAVNAAVRKGRLPAVKWGNWWILRSDALRARFYTGRGKGPDLNWSESADAFIVLASAVGLSSSAIAAMTSWPDKRVLYRLSILRRDGAIEEVIKKYGLHVRYNAQTGDLFADWKEYKGRFPRLALAMEHFEKRQTLRPPELLIVRSVLLKWAMWSEWSEPGIAHSLIGGAVGQARLQVARARLREAGINPWESYSCRLRKSRAAA
jgi:hypothetical protein